MPVLKFIMIVPSAPLAPPAPPPGLGQEAKTSAVMKEMANIVFFI
jgi:hypothetical protein